jgi:hypothetical protein
MKSWMMEDEIGRSCRMHAGDEIYTKFWFENSEGK